MKILVVDDTIFYRKVIKDILEELPGIEVVGVAHNGKVAVDKIKRLKPDLLTLDVEMPTMNGLETLQEIQNQNLDVQCLMVSSKTQKGSEITVQALALGAFDFISKPDVSDPNENKSLLKKEISNKLRGYSQQIRIKKLLKGSKTSSALGTSSLKTQKTPVSIHISPKAVKRTEKSHIIAIGSSTGGPNALISVLSELPANIGVPIVITQHMPPVFTSSLARTLNQKCELTVKEASNGEVLKSNFVYIAPGGKQMKVATDARLSKMIRITDDPAENNCKPSVDYLFRSIAREYGSKATGVILTGMGTDGKLGLSVMKSAGAVSFAQNAETCVVYGMPKAVIDAGLVDFVLPLNKIGREIKKTV